MKKVYLHAQVDEEKCTGDKLCEFVCPSGAIEIANKKARVGRRSPHRPLCAVVQPRDLAIRSPKKTSRCLT